MMDCDREAAMERHDLLERMATLHLSGMRAAYDEVMREGLR